MGMGSGLHLLTLLAILSSWQRGSAASPTTPDGVILTFSLLNSTCVEGQCGMGKCKADGTGLLGFSCECNPGWGQLFPGILPFLPCIIPNCTLSFSCSNVTESPPEPPAIPSIIPTNLCFLSFCGEGDCVSNSSSYRCDCRPGYSNLLNISAFPCIRECSLGADCQPLLNTPTNQSPPVVPNPANRDPRQIPVTPPPPISDSSSRETLNNNRRTATSTPPGGIAWIIALSSLMLLAQRR